MIFELFRFLVLGGMGNVGKGGEVDRGIGIVFLLCIIVEFIKGFTLGMVIVTLVFLVAVLFVLVVE